MSEARRLVQHGTLPVRLTSADRIAHMTEDVQDMTAKLRASITELAAKDTVTGWTLDEDSWEAAANGRVIVMSAVMRRAS